MSISLLLLDCTDNLGAVRRVMTESTRLAAVVVWVFIKLVPLMLLCGVSECRANLPKPLLPSSDLDVDSRILAAVAVFVTDDGRVVVPDEV